MVWDDEATDKLIDLYNEGASYADMVRKTGAPYNSIKAKLSLLRRDDLIGSRHEGRWTVALDDEVRRLRGLGKTYSEIATVLGFHRNAVISRVRRLLKPNYVRPSRVKTVPSEVGRERVTYNVHPMWSMPEEERRIAFYEKFAAGWAEVQERLEADHKEKQIAGTKHG
jgi:hypothetical protein